jgi:cysteinyl-tRNA synthetase
MRTDFDSNRLVFQLKQQYRDRIDFLQSQINRQQSEINQLKEQIALITKEKDYDC